MKSPRHQYAWDKFWDYEDENQESSSWAAVQDEEDRRILALEVEGMIEESIPKNLEPLRHAHKACDWAAVPKNAASDLESAISTVVIEDGELDADCIFARLHPRPMSLEEATAPRPQVELSFPRHNLDIFVMCLDQYASRTMQGFKKGYPYFLRSIPASVSATLDFCLIDLVVPTLMDKLRAE